MERKVNPWELEGAPPNWWRKPLPKGAYGRSCFRTKSDALRVFADYNRDTIDAYGGESAVHRPAEFDAINAFYDLRGKRRVRTIAEALWEVLRGEPPWCLSEIDVALLNRTTPGQYGRGFQIPQHAEEERLLSAQERYYEDQAIREGRITDCFTNVAPPAPPAKGRRGRRRSRTIRQCVCRGPRGRFVKCPRYEEPVPF
jgi:hypothetical protein